MKFHVVGWDYTVHIVSPMPLDGNGNAVEAIIDYELQRIEIWHGIRGKQRRRKLKHELSHALRRHCPPASDEEGACNWDATYSDLVEDQLDAQGGITALDRLPIEEPVYAPEIREPTFVAAEDEQGTQPFRQPAGVATLRRMPDTPEPVYMACCGRVVATGDAWRGDILHDGLSHYMERAVGCGACQRVLHWMESCTVAGRATGEAWGARLLDREESKVWADNHADFAFSDE